jgi:hypothetical protein
MAVERGAVAAEAGAVVEVRREEAAEEPIAAVRHRHRSPGRRGLGLVGTLHVVQACCYLTWYTEQFLFCCLVQDQSVRTSV